MNYQRQIKMKDNYNKALGEKLTRKHSQLKGRRWDNGGDILFRFYLSVSREDWSLSQLSQGEAGCSQNRSSVYHRASNISIQYFTLATPIAVEKGNKYINLSLTFLLARFKKKKLKINK